MLDKSMKKLLLTTLIVTIVYTIVSLLSIGMIDYIFGITESQTVPFIFIDNFIIFLVIIYFLKK